MSGYGQGYGQQQGQGYGAQQQQQQPRQVVAAAGVCGGVWDLRVLVPNSFSAALHPKHLGSHWTAVVGRASTQRATSPSPPKLTGCVCSFPGPAVWLRGSPAGEGCGRQPQLAGSWWERGGSGAGAGRERRWGGAEAAERMHLLPTSV